MASRPTRERFKVGSNAMLRHTLKCDSNKVGYMTKAVALDLAESMMARGRVNPGCHITPYLCDLCHEWHVGNRRIVPVSW